MTTHHRFCNKYRIEIRERDHGPPHVHLVGGEVDVVIDLRTLQVEGRCPRSLLAEALAWVTQNQQELMEEWDKWHP